MSIDNEEKNPKPIICMGSESDTIRKRCMTDRSTLGSYSSLHGGVSTYVVFFYSLDCQVKEQMVLMGRDSLEGYCLAFSRDQRRS